MMKLSSLLTPLTLRTSVVADTAAGQPLSGKATPRPGKAKPDAAGAAPASPEQRQAHIAAELQALQPVAPMMAQLRALHAQYQRSAQALVAVRRLHDGWDKAEPQMHWTVQRELVATAGDAAALATFDAEHGAELRTEQQANADMLHHKVTAPAKIRALEAHMRDLARQMQAACDTSLMNRCAEEALRPASERVLQAAQTLAQLWAELQGATHVVQRLLHLRCESVSGLTLEPTRLELLSRRSGDELLPGTVPAVPYDSIKAVNRLFAQMDDATVQTTRQVLDAMGVNAQEIKLYYCSSDAGRGNDDTPVYAHDPHPRIKPRTGYVGSGEMQIIRMP